MAAHKKRKTRASRSSAKFAPTLGPVVCRWMEGYRDKDGEWVPGNLVHGPGDYLGQPFRLTEWERGLIWAAYELRPDGSRKYRRALVGLGKGNGKTEIAAAIGIVELAGPVVFDGWNGDGLARGAARLSPEIPCGAASYDQADRVFGTAKAMIENGPLADSFECYEKVIYAKGKTGSMYRVAAEAGTNDGGRPTLFIADELHEWLGRKARVHLVISNGLKKRADSWGLAITTAGYDRESLLGKLYDYGCQVRDGLIQDEGFLFVWCEAKPSKLANRKQLERAIREANPAAGDFLDVEDLVRTWDTKEIEEHEFRRYHLNQWVSAPDAYMPDDLWKATADTERKVPDGAEMVLGFDGSYNRDSTALVGCTVESPHLMTLGVWERPKKDGKPDQDWKVDKDEVEERILDAITKYKVLRIVVDETYGRMWSFVFDSLATKGVEVVEFPTRSPSRMSMSCVPFKAALRDGELTHDGNPRLAVHMANGKLKEDRFGPRIAKDLTKPDNWIDLAVAGIVAFDGTLRLDEQREPGDLGITVGNYG